MTKDLLIVTSNAGWQAVAILNKSYLNCLAVSRVDTIFSLT